MLCKFYYHFIVVKFSWRFHVNSSSFNGIDLESRNRTKIDNEYFFFLKILVCYKKHLFKGTFDVTFEYLHK